MVPSFGVTSMLTIVKICQELNAKNSSRVALLWLATETLHQEAASDSSTSPRIELKESTFNMIISR